MEKIAFFQFRGPFISSDKDLYKKIVGKRLPKNPELDISNIGPQRVEKWSKIIKKTTYYSQITRKVYFDFEFLLNYISFFSGRKDYRML